MENKIIGNIRKNNIKSLIILTIFGVPFNLGLIFALSGQAGEGTILYLIFFGILSAFFDYIIFKTIKLIVKPLSSDIFKKYGSLENITKILKEIDETKEYEDEHIIVSKNYVVEKKDYENLIAFDDILTIHKLVHKTNNVIDRYSVIIIDKYDQKLEYSYSKREENIVDYLLLLIGSKSKNAMLGYTKEAFAHVKNNKVPLPDLNDKIYKCSVCGQKNEIGDNFCKSCGCKLS